VTKITVADLAAPTDPDGPVPAWMQALRENAKNAAILGEPTPVVLSDIATHRPIVDGQTLPEARGLAYDATEPGPAPVMTPPQLMPRPVDLRALETRDAPLRQRGSGVPSNGTEPMGEVLDVSRVGPRGTHRMDHVGDGLTEEQRFQATAARLAREVREVSPGRSPTRTNPSTRPQSIAPQAKKKGGGGSRALAAIGGAILVVFVFAATLFAFKQLGVFGGGK
jgi:hypothetical protein